MDQAHLTLTKKNSVHACCETAYGIMSGFIKNSLRRVLFWPFAIVWSPCFKSSRDPCMTSW